ncbi:hypothetical protein DSO57_1001447 [Entomophthora muscae]|uniref:Uncharacterized protein n=1 Tax=Entomophthora muscae TaxID=34485 RepID=A0ACC2UIU5_9FUNG|nr:hypothetical protein DSO57_1001447 [Entomophthora muscae]
MSLLLLVGSSHKVFVASVTIHSSSVFSPIVGPVFFSPPSWPHPSFLDRHPTLSCFLSSCLSFGSWTFFPLSSQSYGSDCPLVGTAAPNTFTKIQAEVFL